MEKANYNSGCTCLNNCSNIYVFILIFLVLHSVAQKQTVFLFYFETFDKQQHPHILASSHLGYRIDSKAPPYCFALQKRCLSGWNLMGLEKGADIPTLPCNQPTSRDWGLL
jgi:hypothetical protein